MNTQRKISLMGSHKSSNSSISKDELIQSNVWVDPVKMKVVCILLDVSIVLVRRLLAKLSTSTSVELASTCGGRSGFS